MPFNSVSDGSATWGRHCMFLLADIAYAATQTGHAYTFPRHREVGKGIYLGCWFVELLSTMWMTPLASPYAASR